MTLGLALISALLAEGRPENMQQLRDERFTSDEQASWRFLRDYHTRHGGLPTVEVMEENGHRLTPAKGNFGYHLERVERRMIYNTIQRNHRPLVDAMQARDMDAAVDALNAMQAEVARVREQRTVTTNPEVLARMEEEMNGCSMRQLAEQETENTLPIVEGIIAPGVTLFSGDPKVGKSLLMMCVALAVARGEPALGSLRTGHGPVLYWDLEGGKPLFKKRLERLNMGNPENMRGYFKCKKLDRGGIEDIEAKIVEHQPALVVIDTFAAVRQEANDRKPIQQKEYGDLQELSRIAKEHDVAIVVICHTNKGQGRDPVARTAGSHGQTGAADSVLTLFLDGDHAATLKAAPRDMERRNFHLIRNRETVAWEVTGVTLDHALNGTGRMIHDHLTRHPFSSPAQIAAGTGLNANTVRASLSKMKGWEYKPENVRQMKSHPCFVLPEGSTSDRTYVAVPGHMALMVSEWMRPDEERHQTIPRPAGRRRRAIDVEDGQRENPGAESPGDFQDELPEGYWDGYQDELR